MATYTTSSKENAKVLASSLIGEEIQFSFTKDSRGYVISYHGCQIDFGNNEKESEDEDQ